MYDSFNQIMREYTKHDAIAVASIFEAVGALSQLEYPVLKQVWVLSENYKVHQNSLPSVIILFIGIKYGLSVRGFFHSEPHQVKRVEASHFLFACAMSADSSKRLVATFPSQCS